ncbi:prealbumin-like fold domain-containing protein [[Ruminococcus] torques]|nr:prealbumin-like fold domain-containing protein [[Ruminococcus] torques]
MKEEQKVSGDPFYKNTEGEVVLPLGTVTFQEIKAPEGYLLNNEIFIETVREEGTGQTDTIFQCPTIPDQIIRGNLQIVKFREDKEEESEQGEQKVPLEGIVFTITSKTTGWQCEIVTDENGYASTFRQGEEQQKGGLVYDTYIVSEKRRRKG